MWKRAWPRYGSTEKRNGAARAGQKIESVNGMPHRRIVNPSGERTSMTKYLVTVPGVLLLAILPAAAQPVPRVETSFNYSYIRFEPAGSEAVPTFHANGGNFQLTYNFNRWVGLVGDFGGYRSGGLRNYGVDSTMANFLFGPRFSFRKQKRVNPYVQAL